MRQYDAHHLQESELIVTLVETKLVPEGILDINDTLNSLVLSWSRMKALAVTRGLKITTKMYQ